MPMMTREMLKLENTGHAGINSLFPKAHSMDWDLDRYVDWDIEISPDEPCIDPEWASFGRTATYGVLPEPLRNSLARRELARTINVLQVGESVAQDVCAKLALVCEKEDHRNHAVAQAMDEARHHMAYARFLVLMDEGPEPIDGPTEAMFDSLLVSFTEKAGASVIIRGLRAVSDFEYEFQMAAMNSRLNQGVETVFLMAADKYQFISSRLVKEVGELGGNIGHFVSEAVKKRLEQRFSGGSP